MSNDFYFCEKEFQEALSKLGENTFDKVWNWPREWVEPINERRGGWSGVTKHQLKNTNGNSLTVYLKRQENQTRRARASFYRPRPSFWFEYNSLSKVNSTQPIGPKLLCYSQRSFHGDLQAILVSASLEGYLNLEEILNTPTLTPRYEEFLRSAGKVIRALHQLNLVHGALYTKHIFLDTESAHCQLIDFEKTYRPFFMRRAQKQDIDRLFRRSTKLIPKFRDTLMAEINKPDNYKSRIKSELSVAEAYTRRKQHKHDAEMRLIRKALAYLNGVNSFLDAPCGTGRATIMLTREGYTTTGVDLGEAAVTVARQELEKAGVLANIEQADIEKLQYQDGSFDAILCFRLYHHFPDDEIREKVIGELCRVAKNYVLISYLSPFSFTSIKRNLRATLLNKPSRQHTTSLASIENLFIQNNFKLVRNIPRQRFFHTLHLAVFERARN